MIKNLRKAALGAAVAAALCAASAGALAKGPDFSGLSAEQKAIAQKEIARAKKDRCDVNMESVKTKAGALAGLAGGAFAVWFNAEGCGGGNSWGVSGAVYEISDKGAARKVGDFGGPTIDAVAFKEGYLLTKGLEQGEDDPRCCPSMETITVWGMKDGKLAALKSKQSKAKP